MRPLSKLISNVTTQLHATILFIVIHMFQFQFTETFVLLQVLVGAAKFAWGIACPETNEALQVYIIEQGYINGI